MDIERERGRYRECARERMKDWWKRKDRKREEQEGQGHGMR